jgi:hypothetical protein
MTMVLDEPRRYMMDALAAMTREGVRTFTRDDLELPRCNAGLSRAWTYNFMEEIEANGTVVRLMGRSPAAWRFTDQFRLASVQISLKKEPRKRVRKPKAKPGA